MRRLPISTRTDTLLPYTTLFRSFGSAAQRARDKAVQTRMNRIARRDDLAAFNGAIPAPEIADESACFAHQKDTGGDIPKLQVALPKAVETRCRDPGQIERSRSEAGDARDFGSDRDRKNGVQGKRGTVRVEHGG